MQYENNNLSLYYYEYDSIFQSGYKKIFVSYLTSIEYEITNQKTIDEFNAKRRIGCYIATCVYGSYDCPQVWTLRRFRDDTLGKTWYGRAFIKCYYAISPTLVKWFGETRWFKHFWKTKLDKMVVRLNKKGISDFCYRDRY